MAAVNLANFLATQHELYGGGMRWWIEHPPRSMIRYSELKTQDRHCKPGYENTVIGRVAAIFQDDEWRSIAEVAQMVGRDHKAASGALHTLTRRDVLIRIGEKHNYRFRRAT